MSRYDQIGGVWEEAGDQTMTRLGLDKWLPIAFIVPNNWSVAQKLPNNSNCHNCPWQATKNSPPPSERAGSKTSVSTQAFTSQLSQLLFNVPEKWEESTLNIIWIILALYHFWKFGSLFFMTFKGTFKQHWKRERVCFDIRHMPRLWCCSWCSWW